MITLEEAEGDRWPEPEAGSTSLIVRCHALRRKPLSALTAADLRIMLSQQIGVPVLLPIAVEVLSVEPLVEGDFYPGDLLSAVLRLPETAWSHLPGEQQRLREVLRILTATVRLADDTTRLLIERFLQASA